MIDLVFLGTNTIIILVYGLFNSHHITNSLVARDLSNIGFLLIIPSFLLFSLYQDSFYWLEAIMFLMAIAISYLITEQRTTYDTWILYTLTIWGFHGILNSQDLLTIYLYLELQTICLYILITLPTASTWSTEAGIKYIITGALASSIFLLGSLTIYGFTGQTDLTTIFLFSETSPLFITGFSLLGIALIIKLGLTPFHSWIPDVYQGTSTPITAFLSTLPKLILFLLITRIIMALIPQWQTFFLMVAILSVVLGAWAGLNQTRIKRLLAYSTINHSGLMIFSLSLLNLQTIKSILIYLNIYIINSLQTFSTLLSIQNKRTLQYFPFIGQYLSLAITNPPIAFCLIIGLLSMAGIPPLAGFWAKWNIYVTTIFHIHSIAVLTIIMISTLAAYFYLRLLRQAYFLLPTFYPTSLINVINGINTAKWITTLLLSFSTISLLIIILEPSLLLLTIDKITITTC